MMISMNFWRLCSTFVGAILLLSTTFTVQAFAQAVMGTAPVISGDVEGAKERARTDAMRKYVESKIGVHVSSSTEVVRNMVVADKISAASEGYVLVKKVISEKVQDGICVVVLDLEADDKKIQTAPDQLSERLRLLSRDSSRHGVQVAISGRGRFGQKMDTDILNSYMQAKLEDIGFYVVVNDEVRSYMDAHPNEPSGVLGAEARRLAKSVSHGRVEANSILRGTVNTLSVKKLGERYEAVVNASFEMIGLDSNASDTYFENVAAVGSSAKGAEDAAVTEAVRRASDMLGARSLLREQEETRGGVRHIAVTLRFRNASSDERRQIVRNALETTGCRVIRAVMNGNDMLVSVEAVRYNSIQELSDAITEAAPSIHIGQESESELGSTKVEFSF